MNATKFVVLLFIGVVCANADARQLKVVSKDTKSSLSVPKTVAANSLGAELYVSVGTGSSTSEVSQSSASRDPSGPGAAADGISSAYTTGNVYVDGTPAYAESGSGSGSQGTSEAASGTDGASARGAGTGGGSSSAVGYIP
ncbi:hypothetical protein AALP_AA2G019900 [Arabis alpina]|uniref:Uncharacterized protein n=1 Tax=Arabis alpina TaxID=50452 RepID=A0A087HER8_ARAAL|nr:hypothetical protein AALP_AA2G019900 [Arabis alpina]